MLNPSFLSVCRSYTIASRFGGTYIPSGLCSSVSVRSVGASDSYRRGPCSPKALIQGTELEDELAIQQRPLNTVDYTTSDGAETSVARNFVVAERDRDVVKRGRVWRPQADGWHRECALYIRCAVMRSYRLVGLAVNDSDLYCCTSVARTGDGGVDWTCQRTIMFIGRESLTLTVHTSRDV